jgi:hypothetical protein
MKPTPQISHNQHAGFPLTDYNFQGTVEAPTTSSDIPSAAKSPAFHKLSSEFFGAEAYRDYVAEFSAFTVLGLISAWPILSMLHAITRMVRNY